MADVNAPSDQTPTMASPVRADDQILPHISWIPIRKSNCDLDQEKSQSNPIYKIAKAGCYKCQLDEQWFDLTKETLREALQITPVNRNQAFAAPPSINGLIDFVNQLGYHKLVLNLSTVVTNDLFQPWGALLTIINLCLTGKTSGFERPRAPVLQILWGIVTGANIDYAERIWEEFTQSIHTFIKDKQNLSRHTSGKKRATLIVIPSIWFTKLIIHHLQRKHRFHPRPDSPLHLSNEEPVLGYLNAKGTKREIFGMPIPGRLITINIREASYYQEYQENVAKHRGFLAGETKSTQDLPALKPAKPARKPQSTTQKAPPKPSISSSATRTTNKPAKAKRIKRSVSCKTRQSRSSPKSVGELDAEEVPAEEPQIVDKDANFQKAVEESMKDAYALPKNRSHQWSSGNLSRKNINLSQKYQERARLKCLRNSEDESEKIMLQVEKGGQDEGQTGPDPNVQAEGQTGSNTGAQAEGQAGLNPDGTSEGQAGSNPNETFEG
nr:monodehydroascorbate reductase [Tanacetum cinerariifolium]